MAKEHISKDSQFWDSVLWSDESKYELFGLKKERKRAWRRSALLVSEITSCHCLQRTGTEPNEQIAKHSSIRPQTPVSVTNLRCSRIDSITSPTRPSNLLIHQI
ncbi:hypothetical protein AVEN_225249-1 [Araneus ventricosus]|uniref:Uncharacterized protein n=1 Tax=Araneus ventricosus TaxID=182803 RepID=A0A4Y2AMV3_ARAVE|nr:hypothetical protein AVEN_225249-1 [Araneus ventricosus]